MINKSIFLLLLVSFLFACKKSELADLNEQRTSSGQLAFKAETITTASSYTDGWNKNLSYPSPSGDPQNFDIWLPASRNKNTTKLFVFIHGGSFTGGDKTGGEGMDAINAIKTEFPDCAIATINYRVGLTMLLDKPIEDVQNAIHYIIGLGDSLNISTTEIVLVGESAGAYLAFFEGLRRDAQLGNQERYKAIVSLSGFAQLLPATDSKTTFVNKLAIQALSVKVPDFNYAAYSPVRQIPALVTHNDLQELYLFYGEDDSTLSGDNSINVINKVKETGNQQYISTTYLQSFAKEGHTMSAAAKKSIAAVLKQKIKYKPVF